MSPAMAGRFLTTAPAGKSPSFTFTAAREAPCARSCAKPKRHLFSKLICGHHYCGRSHCPHCYCPRLTNENMRKEILSKFTKITQTAPGRAGIRMQGCISPSMFSLYDTTWVSLESRNFMEGLDIRERINERSRGNGHPGPGIICDQTGKTHNP